MVKLYAACLFFFVISLSKIYAQVPSIQSFNPSSGPVGTEVEITGTNFNGVSTNNSVYFGGMLAEVKSASTTKLVVIVPASAQTKPIIIVNKGTNLLTQSKISFQVTNTFKKKLGAEDFTTSQNFSAGSGPTDLVVADFDQDGRPDVIIANIASNYGSFYRNISVVGGMENFAPQQTLNIGGSTNLHAADLNGDGKLDLIITYQYQRTVSILFNRCTPGIMAFEPWISYTAAGEIYDITAADFDGDGRIDILAATAESYGNTLSVFRNTTYNGAFSLADAKTFPGTHNFRKITYGDLDGDGKLDVVASNDNSLQIFRNTSTVGTITFGNVTQYLGNSAFDIGDVDNDGKLDLASINYDTGNISVYKNTASVGTITFDAAKIFPSTRWANRLVLEDVNGDGKLDILVNPDRMRLLQNSSTTTINFDLQVEVNNDYGPVTAVDMNMDGAIDLVTCNQSGALAVYRNNPQEDIPTAPIITSFEPKIASIGADITIKGSNFGSAVIKNDVFFGTTKGTVKTANANEIVVTAPSAAAYQNITVVNKEKMSSAISNSRFIYSPLSSKKAIYQSDFQPQVNIRAAEYIRSTKPVDIDNDGRIDFVTIYNTDKYTISYNRNIGAGPGITDNTFASKIDLATVNSQIISMAIGDMNNDGLQDIIFSYGTKIGVLVNTSVGATISFSLINIQIDNGGGIADLVVGDLDSDGRLDFIGYNSNSILTYKNTTVAGKNTLSFIRSTTLNTNTGPFSLNIADMDGDGKPEIVIGEAGSAIGDNRASGLAVYRNISTSTFAFEPVVRELNGYGLNALSLIDINQDQKLDVVFFTSGLYDSGQVLLVQNNSSVGQLSFADHVYVLVGDSPYGGTVGDVDGDGKPDIVMYNAGNTFSIMRNDYEGGPFTDKTFAPKITININAHATAVVLADLDNDNRLDVITTNYSASSIFRNSPNLLQSPPIIDTFTPKSAKEGMVVTITGNFFKDATSVTFGGTPALRYKVVSTTVIEATIDVGSSGDVGIVTPDGKTKKAGFTFISPPILTSFSPATGASGTKITITGTNFTGANAVSFGSIPAQSFTVISDTQIEAIVNQDGNSGNIYVTTAIGTGGIGGFKFPPPLISTDGNQKYIAGAVIAPLVIKNTGGKIPDGLFGQVTTFAGSGSIGSKDATGVEALFSYPSGIASDRFGNIFVTENTGHRVRKITPAGVVTTFAGNGLAGNATGIGSAASFNVPLGIAVDVNGNVFLADNKNKLIRKITPDASVSTFAGGGTTAEGQGTAASFSNPVGVAVDLKGNVYVTDQGQQKVRKITPFGYAGTLAGSGSSGKEDGAGTSASFNIPRGITVDPSGNVFITDYSNNLIRKILPDGTVSTVAGGAVSSSADGQGTAASFYSPYGIVIDGGENLYVTDELYNLIRKISPGMYVSTIAGNRKQGKENGLGTDASFTLPFMICTDFIGNLFIADAYNHQIRKLKVIGYSISPALPEGLVLNENGTITGTPKAGSVSTEYTITAYNVSGNSSTKVTLEVTNPGPPEITSFAPTNATIGETVTLTGSKFLGTSTLTFGDVPVSSFKVESDTKITAVIGLGSTGDVKLTTPGGTVTKTGFVYTGPLVTSFTPQIAPAGKTITITGTGFTNVSQVSFGTTPATSFTVTSPTTILAVLGSGSTGNISVTTNKGTGFKAGFIKAKVDHADISYPNKVTYSLSRPITPLTPTVTGGTIPAETFATVTTYAGTGYSGDVDGPKNQASFNWPISIVMDAAGNSYVKDLETQAIRKISTAGIVSTFISGNVINSIGTGNFPRVGGLAIDPTGNIYIAVDGLMVIKKITPAGVVSTFAGNGQVGNANGASTVASFNVPAGLACDLQGNVYVADLENHMIRKITPAGIVSTLAGSVVFGNKDANGIDAQFNWPRDLAVDALGNVIVMDSKNNTVRKITPDGTVTTIAGSGTAGYADGLGKAASFNFRNGLAIDDFGNIYLSDNLNYRIRQITPDGLVSTVAGQAIYTSNDGVGTKAGIQLPGGMTFDQNGVLYFVEQTASHRVKKISLFGYTISPTLPAGLSFNEKTGVISGTPTIETAAKDYTITAYSLGGSSKSVVNITITPFNLPVDNFTIKGVNPSCIGKEDGSIVITAKVPLNYHVVVTSAGSVTGDFTSGITFSNLKRFPYTICITVPGQPEFIRCFQIGLIDPKPLSVYATVNKEDKKLDLQLSGGERYTITLNGQVFTTAEPSYSLNLINGINSLSVSTDKSCLGTYTQEFSLGNGVKAYPNPFIDIVTVDLDENKSTFAAVEVIDSSGKKVYEKTLPTENGTLPITLSQLTPGIYVLKVKHNQITSILKIWKK